ncbi:MAG TPA: HD domain-containing protein, partial [Bacteroidales bacterium]|nr:HD domain-containing protein [Bacteroidales bacterium]
MKLPLNHDIFRIVSEIVTEKNLQCFVIGGYVRDLLLKRLSKDIDIVVVGSGIDLAKSVAKKIGKKGKISVYRNFGTAMLRYDDFELEFVGARKESYRSDSRKPLVEDGTLEDDLNRRDFTINALAISLNNEDFGKLIDPFNGVTDLKNKIIRTPLDPDVTFSDDPLRMMRAIRFSAQLGFNIEEKSFKSIRKNRERICIISRERIIEEINKFMQSEKPSVGFMLMEQTGLLELVFAELGKLKGISVVDKIHHKDNFLHTMQVLDQLAEKSDNIWLRWAAVMHDIAKPNTRKYIKGHGWTFHGHEFIGSKMVPEIFRRMHLPLGANMRYVQKLVLLHLRPIALVEEAVTDSAVRRLLFEAGDDIDDLMMLCEADITSKNDEKVRVYLNNFQMVRQKLKEIEEKDAIRNFQPPVDGELIMKTFNIGPGREVGIIKNAIKEAILDGTIHNNYTEAYDLMLKKGMELGL